MKTSHLNRFSIPALTLAIALSVGCTPTLDVRGNDPLPEMMAMIQLGKTSREDVQAFLGSPSTTSILGDETWQYISSKTETVAFFEPEVKERRVVSIIFDASGVVKKIVTKELQDGREITSVTRETPTAGREMTILEQLVGNVGRFSKDAAEK